MPVWRLLNYSLHQYGNINWWLARCIMYTKWSLQKYYANISDSENREVSTVFLPKGWKRESGTCCNGLKTMITESADVPGSALPLWRQYASWTASADSNYCFQAILELNNLYSFIHVFHLFLYLIQKKLNIHVTFVSISLTTTIRMI